MTAKAPANIVASVVNGRATFQLRDIQGSIVVNAPASGPLSASTEYDPFGIVTTSTPNVIDWLGADRIRGRLLHRMSQWH